MSTSNVRSARAGLLVVVIVGVALASQPSEVFARQYMASRHVGDPGDGSEAEQVGGRYGDLRDGGGGDATDGDGWMSQQCPVATETARSRTAASPGDRVEALARKAAAVFWTSRPLDLAWRLAGRIISLR